MNISGIDFSTITDYLILLIFVLTLINENKTDIKHLIKEYAETVEKLHSQVPSSVFNQIMRTDYKSKLSCLKTIFNL